MIISATSLTNIFDETEDSLSQERSSLLWPSRKDDLDLCDVSAWAHDLFITKDDRSRCRRKCKSLPAGPTVVASHQQSSRIVRPLAEAPAVSYTIRNSTALIVIIVAVVLVTGCRYIMNKVRSELAVRNYSLALSLAESRVVSHKKKSTQQQKKCGRRRPTSNVMQGAVVDRGAVMAGPPSSGPSKSSGVEKSRLSKDRASSFAEPEKQQVDDQVKCDDVNRVLCGSGGDDDMMMMSLMDDCQANGEWLRVDYDDASYFGGNDSSFEILQEEESEDQVEQHQELPSSEPQPPPDNQVGTTTASTTPIKLECPANNDHDDHQVMRKIAPPPGLENYCVHHQSHTASTTTDIGLSQSEQARSLSNYYYCELPTIMSASGGAAAGGTPHDFSPPNIDTLSDLLVDELLGREYAPDSAEQYTADQNNFWQSNDLFPANETWKIEPAEIKMDLMMRVLREPIPVDAISSSSIDFFDDTRKSPRCTTHTNYGHKKPSIFECKPTEPCVGADPASVNTDLETATSSTFGRFRRRTTNEDEQSSSFFGFPWNQLQDSSSSPGFFATSSNAVE